MKSGVELLGYLADSNNRERVGAMARSLLGDEVTKDEESAFVKRTIIALGMALMEADAVDATRKTPVSNAPEESGQ